LQALATPRGAQSSSLPVLATVAGVLALGLAAASVLLFLRSRDDAPASGPSASVTADAAPAVSASAAHAATTCPEGMAQIPAGKFFMGSDEPGATDAERPSFQVTLPGFCIDTHEVRTSAYRACSERGECRRATQAATWPGITDQQKSHYEPECNGVREDRLDHPVNCVDFAMAEQFCKFKHARLPTEAEWEYATRGSDGRLYPWGDAPPTEVHLNACSKECVAWGQRVGESLLGLTDADDGHPTTAPVGSFQAGRSQWGALDLAGNVWEWVGSWHAPYTRDPKVAPAGPTSGEKRVIRGGAWNGGDKSWLRPSFRYAQVPEARHPAIGFRCAKSL
jgi:formylglycine-generating enzyme required for sulfatase activity